MNRNMADWQTYLLLAIVAIVALKISVWRLPTEFHKIGRALVLVFVGAAFWTFFDRVGAVGDAVGFSRFWMLALLIAGGLAIYWTFTRQAPKKELMK